MLNVCPCSGALRRAALSHVPTSWETREHTPSRNSEDVLVIELTRLENASGGMLHDFILDRSPASTKMTR
jgi:hypothetical protein